MHFVTGFFRFWYDFVVGDAWEIAAGVVAVLAAGALLIGATAVDHDLVPPLMAAGVVLVVAGSLIAEARRRTAAG
jgi:hypothetical protein